jgi:hypothetical protein
MCGSGLAVTVAAAGGRGRLGIVSFVVDPWVGGGEAARAVSGGACTSRRAAPRGGYEYWQNMFGHDHKNDSGALANAPMATAKVHF